MSLWWDWFFGRLDDSKRKPASSAPPSTWRDWFMGRGPYPYKQLPPPEPMHPRLEDARTAQDTLIARVLHRLGFKTPEDIIHSYLDPTEEVILSDGPSLESFLLFEVDDVLRQAIALAVIVAAWRIFGATWLGVVIMLLAFLALLAMVSWSLIKGIRAYFRRYALTTFRVLTANGVLSRNVTWTPWSRVTDVRITQRYFERLLGYGTVRIASASEASGLKELRDVGNPLLFGRVIVAISTFRSGPYLKNAEREDIYDIIYREFKSLPARAILRTTRDDLFGRLSDADLEEIARRDGQALAARVRRRRDDVLWRQEAQRLRQQSVDERGEGGRGSDEEEGGI